jgi:hypothetical protein
MSKRGLPFLKLKQPFKAMTISFYLGMVHRLQSMENRHSPEIYHQYFEISALLLSSILRFSLEPEVT